MEAYGMARESTQGSQKARGKPQRGPRILCWSCRQLTSFEEDRCTHCGARFAGSTGGSYSAAPRANAPIAKTVAPRVPAPPRDELADARRTLHQLLDDLQRVHDVSRTRDGSAEEASSTTLFQCPSCGRFVAEAATTCVCGVRFADAPAMFACPECDAHVPALADECPVCNARFAPEPRTRVVYQCPRCGVEVDEDATRCACGARFAD